MPSPNFPSDGHLLSAIVDSSDDAIVSKDLSGIIMSWNRAAERMFGYAASEAIGNSITLIIPHDRLPEETEILRKIRAGERVEHFQTLRRRRDGTLLPVSLTISPVKKSNGEVVGASKVARDDSQRMRWIEALSQKTRSLKILNRAGAALTGQLDLEKLVQTVTDAGRELCGAAFGAFFYNVVSEAGESYMLYSLSGAPREAFEKFGMPRNTPIFHPTFTGEGVVRIHDVHADPRYGTMAPHHGMPPGHLPVRSYLAASVFSRSGEVLGGLFFGHPEPGIFTEEAEELITSIAAHAGVAVDNARMYAKLERELAQQKVLQEALRESEAFSSSVINSTADCIKVLDLEGRLLAMNSPGLRLFDLEDFEAVKGQAWAALWPPEVRESLHRAIERARGGGIGRFQGFAPTAKNVPKWWDVLISPVLDPLGNVIRLTATSRDISELRKAQEEAMAAEKEADRQSRIKDEFLATLSHELRTPLQSIVGWTQLLRAGESDPAEITEGIEVIERSARAQSRIVEDLLDMNRILSGKVRLDVQPVALAEVIQESVETVKPAAHAKGVRLETVLDPLARPMSGDPARLQQIFWNLLTNAIKFTPRGGRVMVVLERVNSHLEVSVSDTGEGIPADFLPFVFDRFRQADGSTTRRHGGLGLGLAIVKHLVELHGGSVRVKSSGAGQGTCFSVMLPLPVVHTEPAGSRRHPLAQGQSEQELAAPSLAGTSVLLVDDEADSRALLARVLERAGARVRDASEVSEALRAIGTELPDVIISDIGMPGRDGYDFIREVRSLPPTAGGTIPAIALTAYTRREDRIKAVTAGFQIHLAKPVDILELLAVVSRLAFQR